MSYITIDDRPVRQLVLLENTDTWMTLAAITLSNTGIPTSYVSTGISYTDFLQVLSFLQSQTLTKNIVLVDASVLSVLPLIAEAYTNNAVPAGMHFTLVASVQGFNGNANVNKVTFKDMSLKSLDPAVFANATSITLSIVH